MSKEFSFKYIRGDANTSNCKALDVYTGTLQRF